MKRSLILLFYFISPFVLFGKTLHSLSDIMALMEKSQMTYQILELKDDIPSSDYSELLNGCEGNQVITQDSVTVQPFNRNNPFYNQAESAFKTAPDSAYRYYMLAYDSDTTLTIALTYAGQMLDGMNDREQANQLYLKAISHNYIDYLAHWFLADNYLNQGKIDDAVNEIVIARILNRNNPRIKESFDRIMSKAKCSAKDWYFTPQVRITQKNDTSVAIEYKIDWLGYAIAKAAWAYEPGYCASMGVSPGEKTLLEYRECLSCQVASLVINKKMSKDRQLVVLKDAFKKDMLEEYLMYEVVLPAHPQVAYQLTPEFIHRIRDYVLKVRNK